MEREPRRDTDRLRHIYGGNAIGRSIWPGVLVADLGHGASLVQGWLNVPSAYVCADDTDPLQRALEVAFGDGKEIPVSGNGEARP